MRIRGCVYNIFMDSGLYCDMDNLTQTFHLDQVREGILNRNDANCGKILFPVCGMSVVFKEKVHGCLQQNFVCGTYVVAVECFLPACETLVS